MRIAFMGKGGSDKTTLALTSLEFLLYRLLDNDDEYVVADVTAGTDRSPPR